MIEGNFTLSPVKIPVTAEQYETAIENAWEGYLEAKHEGYIPDAINWKNWAEQLEKYYDEFKKREGLTNPKK